MLVRMSTRREVPEVVVTDGRCPIRFGISGMRFAFTAAEALELASRLADAVEAHRSVSTTHKGESE
ncbi:hypothetical protein Gbro_1426 [Gordonia bronchialis DSM 43247]|uniref:Uncharacterized protein n=2 Tax=Gordonia bronchialis TaxID=2054 RepID=D0L6F1_GORB4|nr:hypothetical protein Gbro_1426 [Gordonia bronchialis DSM 43247]STQ63537.1 Uncharacterised protein [Gordonia bronchialis]